MGATAARIGRMPHITSAQSNDTTLSQSHVITDDSSRAEVKTIHARVKRRDHPSGVKRHAAGSPGNHKTLRVEGSTEANMP
jgi:hypothetical protein